MLNKLVDLILNSVSPTAKELLKRYYFKKKSIKKALPHYPIQEA